MNKNFSIFQGLSVFHLFESDRGHFGQDLTMLEFYCVRLVYKWKKNMHFCTVTHLNNYCVWL